MKPPEDSFVEQALIKQGTEAFVAREKTKGRKFIKARGVYSRELAPKLLYDREQITRQEYEAALDYGVLYVAANHFARYPSSLETRIVGSGDLLNDLWMEAITRLNRLRRVAFGNDRNGPLLMDAYCGEEQHLVSAHAVPLCQAIAAVRVAIRDEQYVFD